MLFGSFVLFACFQPGVYILTLGQVPKHQTAGFKVTMIEFALEHGKRAASRKFDVNDKCVRRWCRQKEALKNTTSKKCDFQGKTSKFPELEEELLCYVMEVQNDDYASTTDMLRMKAQAMARAKSVPREDFKASASSVRTFLKSKGLSFRRRTTLCQRLLNDYTNNVLEAFRSMLSACAMNTISQTSMY